MVTRVQQGSDGAFHEIVDGELFDAADTSKTTAEKFGSGAQINDPSKYNGRIGGPDEAQKRENAIKLHNEKVAEHDALVERFAWQEAADIPMSKADKKKLIGLIHDMELAKAAAGYDVSASLEGTQVSNYGKTIWSNG